MIQSPSTLTANPSATVSSATGQSWLTPNSRNLKPGAKFATAPNGALAVYFNNFATVNVYGSTKGAIAGAGVVSGGGWGYTMAISSGSARFASTRPFNNKNSYALIKTPNGVLAHRGTKSFVSTTPDGDFVSVLEGAVNYCDYASYADCDEPFTPHGVLIPAGSALFNDGLGKNTLVPLVKKISQTDNSAVLQFARNLEVYQQGQRINLDDLRQASFVVLNGEVQLDLRFPESKQGKTVTIRTVKS